MGWWKDLMDLFSGGKEKQVVIVTGKNPILKKPSPSKRELKPEPVGDKLEKIFEEFSGSGARFIFFDPEEERCYVYFISDTRADEVTDISLDEWNEINPQLKALHNKAVVFGNKTHYCTLNVSLTNLGERIAVILFGLDADDDDIKEGKRRAIHLTNRLKPATSLTHKNIHNLINMIESRKEHLHGDIFQLFREEGLISLEEMEELKAKGDYRILLSRPSPRKQIVQVIAKWLSAEYFDAEMENYERKTAKKIPEDKARGMNLLAFTKQDGTVGLACGNPFDENIIKLVEGILGTKVIPYLSCEEDIRYELEKIFKEND